MEIQLPQKVQFIIETLNQDGFEAYAVGGCVRDSILGRKPDDWDITTSARPEEVKALFERTVDTGLQHGTVTVLLERDSYEVTTYRIDGEYLDGRHPECVSFTSSLKEDLRRRDFTINAMAYSREKGCPLFGSAGIFCGGTDTACNPGNGACAGEDQCGEDPDRAGETACFPETG